MARGDLVNGILIASGGFQPAAGVEISIFHLTPTGVGDTWSYWNGGNIGFLVNASSAPVAGLRTMLTNAIWLYYVLTTLNGGYGGVQTK